MTEDKLDRAVKAEDSGATKIAELAFFQIKYQALVVKARLKRMSFKATNMAQELRAEELIHTIDRHIASVTSPDGQCQTTKKPFVGDFVTTT